MIDFRQNEELEPEERAPGQVERLATLCLARAYGPLQAAGFIHIPRVDSGDFERRVSMHDHDWLAVYHRERSPQSFVSSYDERHDLIDDIQIKHAAYSNRNRHVVNRRAGCDLLEGPESLLNKRKCARLDRFSKKGIGVILVLDHGLRLVHLVGPETLRPPVPEHNR